MRSITAVTLARWSPWRRRQMQPVIRSLPLLPPSLMLLLLATCISSKTVAIGVSGLVALLLAPPAAHSQRGRGLRLPITACCLRPRNDNAVRSRRPNEVRRILVGDLAHWRVQTKHRNDSVLSCSTTCTCITGRATLAVGSSCHRQTGTAAAAQWATCALLEGKISQ